jgi:thiamine biosynthesis protein ThiS
MHADGTISISINGEHRRVRDGLTLAKLATELGMAANSIIVERNLELVPRSTLASVTVQDGDELEIAPSVP